MIKRLVFGIMKRKYVAFIFMLFLLLGGLLVAPFSSNPVAKWFPELNVSVDALPDIGINQQIIHTQWPGHAPEDVERHITYPLSAYFLGLPGVKSIRAQSLFGKSSLYLIFDDAPDFYWCRTRILEQLSAIPSNLLPVGINPRLGPPATAMGQVYWYSIQSTDTDGNPVSAWSLEELRAIQDEQVKLSLLAVEGVAEVSSIGGYDIEYLIEPNPERLAAYGLSILDLLAAIKNSNLDIGAQSVEINLAEYYVRVNGRVQSPNELEESVLRLPSREPIRIGDVAKVSTAPGARSGMLDFNGFEAVGGVVVAAFNENPLLVVSAIKERVQLIENSLPARILPDGTKAKLQIVAHYDRSDLISESIRNLENTLLLEILIVIMIMGLLLKSWSSSIVVSSMIPLSVLGSFLLMRIFNIQANVMSLGGIAIAIGSMVDYGIIMSEQLYRDYESHPSRFSISNSVRQVIRPLAVAITTTIISFLPLLLLVDTAGKLFTPLVLSKTLLLLVAGSVSIFVLPVLQAALLKNRFLHNLNNQYLKGAVFGILIILLTFYWRPFGPESSFLVDVLFIGFVFFLTWICFHFLLNNYEALLKRINKFRISFLIGIILFVLLGIGTLIRFETIFMPNFSEGAFIYMPTSASNAGNTHMHDVLQQVDRAVALIPEVKGVLGKAGSTESVLDPAPMTMLENLIVLNPEYQLGSNGRIALFKVDGKGSFIRDEEGQLVESIFGKPNRIWREHIKSEADIWETIQSAAAQPTLSAPPMLYPIETRLLMLETGMRSKYGLKIFGTNADSIQKFGVQVERFLREQEEVIAGSVYFDRMAAKPYLEIDIRRDQLQNYNIQVSEVQNIILAAVGGIEVGELLEDRNRNKIRIRFPRELRQSPESISRILISSGGGESNVPLGELVDIKYVQGPFLLRSEDGFLCNYLYFDKTPGRVGHQFINSLFQKLNGAIHSGILNVPEGVSFQMAGTFKNTQKTMKRLTIALPLGLFVILFILWLHFKNIGIMLMVGSSVLTSVAGGAIFYWFFMPAGEAVLSLPVWVGFLVLIGIATDDAVLLATGIRNELRNKSVDSWTAALIGGKRRLRPALLTTFTTLIALLPVITSSGRGMEIIIPMALPIFGGMLFQVLIIFIIPVLFLIRGNNLNRT